MSAADTNGGVTYTIKELLAKIEGKLDGVIITIGQKADKHDVENLAGRVKALEEEVGGFDEARRLAEQVATTLAAKEKADRTWWQQWRMKVAWLLALLVALGQLHQSFPHIHF